MKKLFSLYQLNVLFLKDRKQKTLLWSGAGGGDALLSYENIYTESSSELVEPYPLTALSWWDPIAVMVVFAVVLAVALISISFLLAIKKPDAEKLSPYECGFEPFGHSRHKFDIRYYLVSLLFILFDLEVLYLFPLIAVDHYQIKTTGFIIVSIFIFILAIGILYEFSKEALEKL